MSVGKSFAGAFCGVLLLAFAGCGGAMNSVPQVANTVPQDASAIRPDTVPKIGGTYDGSISETEGSKTATGTVQIVINQNIRKISGTVTPTIDGHSAHLTFSGSVRGTKHGARLTYTIYDPKGRSASGKATVRGTSLNGTAYVPASGSQPAVSITFNTKKQ